MSYFIFCICLFQFLLPTSSQTLCTRYLDGVSGNDTNNCDINTPCKTLARVLLCDQTSRLCNVSSNGCNYTEIYVSPGVYTGLENINYLIDVNYQKLVVRAKVNGTVTFDAEWNSRVLSVRLGTVSFSGLHFHRGRVSGPSEIDGGCVYVSQATVGFLETSFTNCSATSGSGGAVYNLAGNLPIGLENVLVISCEALYGGAVDSNALAVVTSHFYQNNALRNGGALRVYTINVFASEFRGNTAANGGAIYLGDTLSSGAIKQSTFVKNVANKASGGAIFAYDGSLLQITDCKFTDNLAELDGGAFMLQGSIIPGIIPEITMANLSVENNVARSGFGGGLRLEGLYETQFSLSNITITNNYAKIFGGGAIVGGSGRIKTFNVTFFNNSAVYGGGLYCSGGNIFLEGSSVLFDKNRGDNCSADALYGNCTGIFSTCIQNSIVPSCINCKGNNCVIVDKTGAVHCFADRVTDTNCLCSVIPPPPSPTPEESRTGVIVGVTFTVIVVFVIGIILIYCRRSEYRKV